MLSRTASNLYWLSRYLERAENTARMLEVSHSIAMMPSGRSPMEELSAPLRVTGTVAEFWSAHSRLTFEDLYRFLVWNPDHHASIYYCFARARENAHAVRGRITAEMWETVNTTWIDLNRMRRQPPDLKPFCDWVKERSHLWRGTSYGTLSRNDAFHFLRLGTFLERADNTARLLCVKQLDASTTANTLRDYYHWAALLQALGAMEAHQDVYRGKLDEGTVAELLILRSDAPRSLRSCLEEINSLLTQIRGDQGREAKRIARILQAQLEFGELEELQDERVALFLEKFLGTVRSIGDAIEESYLSAI